MELLSVLDAYHPGSDKELHDLQRIRELAGSADPWSRSLPVHVTGSAVVVHPPTARVLLRWHERMQGWLQVGGHADPGEVDPYAIALREAREETGLEDLVAWPRADEPQVVQVAIVPVPAGKGESFHHHADIRYALATVTPERVRPESDTAQLAWLTIDDALVRVGEDNLRTCLTRIAALLMRHGRPGASP
jgi:8-oxo-dGTP pyrophosphatase MutT (NUDIX family)